MPVSACPLTSVTNVSCSEVLHRLQRAIVATGLRVIETFDLQNARLGNTDCTCPNHGTAACDCQMVVLMVYGETGAPAMLMLHGNDGQTWIALLDDPLYCADPLIVTTIGEAVRDIQAASGL